MESELKLHSLSYRPDIDGLRGVAVAIVILFHVSSSIIPGGFVGVDVFFVISGYLITSMIVNELKEGTFSFAAFYGRRIKRIFPASFVCMCVILGLCLYLMLRDDIIDTCYATISALLSVSNFYLCFFVDHGYFAEHSTENPLLHFWSLAVEEQFYAMWPLLLYFIYRTKYLTYILVGLIACSVTFGQLTFFSFPSLAYYMLISRMGELIIGALVCVIEKVDEDWVWAGVFSECCSGLGLCLIAESAFVLSKRSVFPGINALVPSFGAAMIIYGGRSERNTWTKKLLSVKPLNWLGLISYSAYLYHWPILTFMRLEGVVVNGGHILIYFVYVSFSSVVSYFAIERPFRLLKAAPKTIVLGMFAIPMLLLMLIVVCVLFQQNGLINNNNNNVRHSNSVHALNHFAVCSTHLPFICFDPCWVPESKRGHLKNIEIHCPCIDRSKCTLGNLNSKLDSVLLVGDSHAAHHVAPLEDIAHGIGFNFFNWEYAGCPPLLFDTPTLQKLSPACEAFMKNVREMLPKYGTIFLAARWSGYVGNSLFPEQIPAFESLVEDTINKLVSLKKRVLLIGEAPEFLSFKGDCPIVQPNDGSIRYINCLKQTSLMEQRSTIHQFNERLKLLADRTANVWYWEIGEYMCPLGICSPYMNRIRLYADSTHINYEGGRVLGKIIMNNFGPPLAIREATGVRRRLID